MRRVLFCGLVALVPLPAAWADDDKKSDDKGMVIKGKLSPDDPKDRVLGNSPHKVHEQKLKAGKNYQIDLVSGAFDAFLRLEDSTGKQLAQDDDGGGFPNARIMFKAPKDGMYRIIATSLDGKSGSYTLTVKTASAATVAATNAFNSAIAQFQMSYGPAQQKLMRTFAEATTDADREKLLDDFSKMMASQEKRFAKIAKDFPRETGGIQAADMAKRIRVALPSIKGQIIASAGNALRNEYEKAYEAKNKNADSIYKKAHAYFAEGIKKYASNPSMVKELKDGIYLLEKLTLGKTAPEIEGEDLDGKKFKLSDYRGKVVVLDFWGNW